MGINYFLKRILGTIINYKYIPILVFLDIQRATKDLNAEMSHKGSGLYILCTR